jgi:hypothetical protein
MLHASKMLENTASAASESNCHSPISSSTSRSLSDTELSSSELSPLKLLVLSYDANVLGIKIAPLVLVLDSGALSKKYSQTLREHKLVFLVDVATRILVFEAIL